MSNAFVYIETQNYNALEAYLKVENINVLNKMGQNLLHASIMAEFDDAFDLLIKNYINVNAQDMYGNTPLIYTIMYNKIGYFKRLVREGANLNIANNKGETPIMIALNLKKMDMAYILLDSNVNLNTTNSNDENICFSIIDSHNLDLLKKIISKNKDLLYSVNFTKKSLLHEACLVKDKDIALYLLSNGVLSNVCDNFGETPLFISAKEKDYDMIKLLLSYGARLEKRNSFYETVYDVSRPEIKDYLKYQEENIKYLKYGKKYPLHLAVLLGDFAKVKQQVNRYNITKKDDFNYRPIEYAKKLKYTDIYNLLKIYENEL